MKAFLLDIGILIMFCCSCPTYAVVQQQVSKWFKVGSIYIDRNSIIREADRNYNAYINSRGWRKKKRQAFANAYSELITAIYNGYISERNVGRKYIDKRGIIKNSNKGFDAYGEAAYFLDIIIDRLESNAYIEQNINEKRKVEMKKMNDITRVLNKNK